MRCIYAFAFMLVFVTQCCQIKHVSAMSSHLAKLFGCQNNFMLCCHKLWDVFRAKDTLCVCLYIYIYMLFTSCSEVG